MNSLRISHQTEEGTVKPKPKINMEAFTVNQPVKKSTADIAKQELAPAQKKALETRNTTEAVKSPRRQ